MSESSPSKKAPKHPSKPEYIKEHYYEYLEKSGLATAFQIILNEIVGQNIPQAQVFDYTAKRLRDFKELINRKKQ